MKSQKGITLTSLAVYIIGITIVLATVATISTNFYSNTYSIMGEINPLTEYTKFTTFFSDEANHSKIKVLECQEDFVVFDNGVQYTFIQENKGIYRNKVKICKNVQSCIFKHEIINGKETISAIVSMQNDKERRVSYTLKN